MAASGSYEISGDTGIGVSRGRPLQGLIEDALETCKCNGKTFLPDDELYRIMTAENVQDYLFNCVEPSLRARRTDITRHICGRTQRSTTYRGCRRIFAILLLTRTPHLILDFIDHGISDADLPLFMVRDNSSRSSSEGAVDDYDGNDYMARSTKDRPIIIDGFRKWSYPERDTFCNHQWRVNVPIFRKVRRQTPSVHPIYTFGTDVILPWTEYEEHYEGNSVVSRVKVHKAHSELVTGNEQIFALKSLKPFMGQDGEQEFRVEVKALLKVKERPHLAAGLLTSFKYGDRYHLLFRWADGGNLRDLWTKHHPRPMLDGARIHWMAEQVHGLAHGLDGIHNTRMTASEVEAAQGSPLPAVFGQQLLIPCPDPASGNDKGRDYGRHGDIKPENVLWFRKDQKQSEFGILKLSDFGLTTFHRAVTKGLVAAEVRVTHSYSAPERETEESVCRPFDVWSLACIFLEFVTWVLLGSEGIKTFQNDRANDGGGPNEKFMLDNFFTLSRDDEGIKRAGVKPSVSNWVKTLKGRPQCSEYLSELLDYVENKMLLVQKEDRENSEAVTKQLKEMLDKCKQDEVYALRGRRGMGTVNLIYDEPETNKSNPRSTTGKRKRLEYQSSDESNLGPASGTRSRARGAGGRSLIDENRS